MALELKALGRGVTLGELYDAHRSQFLGVQLCNSALVEQHTQTSPAKHTHFTVKRLDKSITKSDVLDVSAEVSAEILGGMITVNGAASYLNDVKSNSSETTWALSLNSTIKYTSIDNVDKIIQGLNPYVVDDFKTCATHFVIKIMYGGDIIFNLVANEETKEGDQEIKGKLHAKLDKLPGAISVEGEIDAKVKEQYKEANEQLEITIHADVALERLPVTLLDALDELPKAVTAITENPVPMIVYLSPLSRKDFDDGGVIYYLDKKNRDTILGIYRDLQDIQSRYSVLQRSCAQYRDIIPALEADVNASAISFQAQNAIYSDGLGTYLKDFKLNEKKATYPAETVTKARDEITKQTKWPGGEPKCLAGLEISYINFIQIVLSLNSTNPDPKQAASQLTSLPRLRKQIIHGLEAALVIMPPLPAKPVPRDYVLFTNLVQRSRSQFSAQKPKVEAYPYYAENLDTLEAVLPSGDQFKRIKVPTAFLGHKKMGKITWTEVKPDLHHGICSINPSCDQHYDPNHSYLEFKADLAKIDATKSFTVVLEASYPKQLDDQDRIIATLSAGYVHLEFYIRSIYGRGTFVDVLVRDEKGKTQKWIVPDDAVAKPLTGIIHSALVQEISATSRAWILYYNGEEAGRYEISTSITLASSAQLASPRVFFPPIRDPPLPWAANGKVYDVRVYNEALDFLQMITEANEASRHYKPE